MNYQDWLNTVDKLLAESGADYTTEQIDRSDLRGAFHQGVTAAEYVAQGGHPISRTTVSIELTLPSPEHVAFLLKVLDRGGLLSLGAGVITVAHAVYQSIRFGSALIEELRINQTPGLDVIELAALDNFIYSGVMGILDGLWWCLFGIVCWALAALLRSANQGRTVQMTVPRQG
ncbi:MAG TPA: hypothetical protein PLB31_05965 [Fimbriimonadaceae bacterium]|mgnify:CR=1 FL=1|nr:hypothetical protein [Fimbriimonadaceae bacterium]HRE94448.1 hypothetical protein [Fimbriimonadaceae bacterium]HRI74002.1 hypothetical protein [Fimbriimonadaceae bacterium]